MKKKIKVGLNTVLLCIFCFLWTANASTTEGGHVASLSDKASSDTTRALNLVTKTEKTAASAENDRNLIKKHEHPNGNVGHKIYPSNKKTTKSTKRSRPLRPQDEGWGCFANCLANSVPIDVVITCAEACATRQYATCAACIGVGTEVVAACGWECLFLEVQ